MDGAGPLWLDAAQKVGIPIVLLAAGVVVIWRLAGQLLGALIESHREQLADLKADRDHFRDRSEGAEDRTGGLARELIDECRGRVKTVSGGPT